MSRTCCLGELWRIVESTKYVKIKTEDEEDCQAYIYAIDISFDFIECVKLGGKELDLYH